MSGRIAESNKIARQVLEHIRPSMSNCLEVRCCTMDNRDWQFGGIQIAKQFSPMQRAASSLEAAPLGKNTPSKERDNMEKPTPGLPVLPKRSLSQHPNFPFSEPNENYFKVPHESLENTGLAGFHERTISRTDNLEKDKARWRIINTFLRTCPTRNKKENRFHHFLTNPGAWWHFERLMAGHLQRRAKTGCFVGCERDAEMYKLSAVMLATVFNGQGVIVRTNTAGIDYVTSGFGTHTLYNADVFEVLKAQKKRVYDGVWLDLTSTITEGLGEKLATLKPRLRPDFCVLAITLIRGREQGAIRDVLLSGKKRKRVLEGIVRSSCGDDFRIADLFDYADSMPMQQVIFVRGARQKPQPKPKEE